MKHGAAGSLKESIGGTPAYTGTLDGTYIGDPIAATGFPDINTPNYWIFAGQHGQHVKMSRIQIINGVEVDTSLRSARYKTITGVFDTLSINL